MYSAVIGISCLICKPLVIQWSPMYSISEECLTRYHTRQNNLINYYDII